MAVIRRKVVATRGLDSTFLTCVSAVLLAVRPTLSVAYSHELVQIRNDESRLTFSRSIGERSPKTSEDENAR